MGTKDGFKLIVKDTAKFFKTVPDLSYLDAFALKAFEYIGPYEDKLKSALKFCVNNQSSFPSIFEFQSVVDKLGKKPIDYIAKGVPDAREVRGCARCDHLGWLEVFNSEGNSTVCICPYCQGQGMHSNLPTCDLARSRGYTKLKERQG